MLKQVALFLTLLAAFQLGTGQTPLRAQATHAQLHNVAPIDLTQLKPVEGQNDWEIENNATVSGRVFDHAGTLRMGSYDYTKTDRIVFYNQKHHDVFEAWVGYHEGYDGGEGSMSFTVLGDGRELFRSDEMRPLDAPARVSVSIKGCRGITLVTTASMRIIRYSELTAVWGDPILRMGKPAKAPSSATINPSASTPTSTTDDTTPDAAPVKNKILQISPARMDELATKLKAALAKDPVFSKSRPTLAIANFKLIPANALDPTNADNVREDLSTAIISTDTFNVVERGQLDQALKELKIGLNDTFDSATAQKLGKLVSAQVVLIGSISDRGSFVVINARLIDTATGRARAAANVEVR